MSTAALNGVATGVRHGRLAQMEVPRVVTRANAIALGMSRHQIDRRLASGAWSRLLPAMFLTTPGPVSWNDRIAAALAYAGDRSLLTGAAALRASEIRVPRTELVTVLVPTACRREGGDWLHLVRTRRLPEPLNWYGPRRARVERAVVDWALGHTDLDDVRTVLARAVRSRWCTVEDVACELESARRNGRRLLRRALADVGCGAASAPEARAAVILRRAGLTGFEQNVRVDVPGGYFVADFLWPRLRAILEIDSVEFHLDPADWRATMDRHLQLESLGYSVIHRPPSALTDRERFVEDVRRWLAARSRA